MSYPPAAYQLGMPIQNYQTSPTVARQRIINGSVALFLAAICLALIPVHITFILPALLLLFYTVRMFLQYRQNQAVSVLLAPDGVLRIKHQEVEAITWDDISEIWLTPSLGYKTLYQYRIHDATKQRLTFTTPADVEFGNMVEHEYAKRRTDIFIDAFANGETLIFGKFSVNRFGLFAGHQHVDWKILQDVKIDKLRIWAYYNGRWHRLAWISEIPNVVLFVTTLKFILTMDL